MLNIPVAQYTVKWDEEKMQHIVIQATRFDKNGGGVVWAVKISGHDMVLGKRLGEFEYEPRPSSRDDAFFDEFRFNTPEEAFACYEKHFG